MLWARQHTWHRWQSSSWDCEGCLPSCYASYNARLTCWQMCLALCVHFFLSFQILSELASSTCKALTWTSLEKCLWDPIYQGSMYTGKHLGAWPRKDQAHRAAACLRSSCGSSQVAGSTEELFVCYARLIAVPAYCRWLCMHTHTARSARRRESA